jgi:hypothetical protein
MLRANLLLRGCDDAMNPQRLTLGKREHHPDTENSAHFCRAAPCDDITQAAQTVTIPL